MAELRECHELLTSCVGGVDPDEHPDLVARINVILGGCDVAGVCPAPVDPVPGSVDYWREVAARLGAEVKLMADALKGTTEQRDDALAKLTTSQAPPASDPPGLNAEAILKSLEIGFCSSNCGPVYRADEDGCCVTCGGDITFHDRSWPLGQTRCTICRDTALPCQLGHTGRMLNVEAAQIPGGLVDLVARWQRAERAWQQAQDDIGQVYEPEGLWEERHELFEALLAYPLPASPQAETTKGDE